MSKRCKGNKIIWFPSKKNDFFTQNKRVKKFFARKHNTNKDFKKIILPKLLYCYFKIFINY
jgi:hypothetical protein